MARTEHLLFDASGVPICDRYGNYNPHSSIGGLYFNPYGAGNAGKFRPWINTYTQDTEESINANDRNQLVAMSRQVFAQMPEIEAASKQKADLTVGLGMDPLWHGEETEWSRELGLWVRKKFYPNCTPYGIAYDWKTNWKTVSMLIDRDGDLLMVLRADRYGFPQIEFIQAHRIGQRFNQAEIQNGRYKGYEVRDGVVYASNGKTPIGYNILGKTEADDTVIATANALLIYNPFCFDKGRGKPLLSAALKDCYNLQDIDDFMSQGIKVIHSVFLIEKNKEGKPSQGRIKNPYAGGIVIPQDEGNQRPVNEFMYGGIRYIKPEGDVANIKSDTIGQTTMDYITRLEKRIMALLEWPHQWMLSPETMGGTMSRGIKETVGRAVQARQQILEKYASVALEYAISRAMTIGELTENYEEDLDNLQFTKAAELILDPGYEHSADLADYFAGLKSADDLLRKWGKGYTNTLNQKVKDVRNYLSTASKLQEELKADPLFADKPELINLVPQLLGKMDMAINMNLGTQSQKEEGK